MAASLPAVAMCSEAMRDVGCGHVHVAVCMRPSLRQTSGQDMLCGASDTTHGGVPSASYVTCIIVIFVDAEAAKHHTYSWDKHMPHP